MWHVFVSMIRRPPRSTRTDTLLPYTTLVRSRCAEAIPGGRHRAAHGFPGVKPVADAPQLHQRPGLGQPDGDGEQGDCRSEEHTSELQSLMRISYAVFCLNNKKLHMIPTRTSDTTPTTQQCNYRRPNTTQ